MLRFMSIFSCLFYISISSAVTAIADETCKAHHCVAVVDAGSSGSRLHLFQYDIDENQNPVAIEEFWSKQIQPGFATIAPRQQVVDAYLNVLFADIPEFNIPVHFYATAGMRLLPQNRQQEFYHELENWFASQTKWQLAEAKTITGSEEGLLGWLAVNYQLGTLTDKDKPLVSVMDMGGSSVEISFPVTNPNAIDGDDLIKVDVYGKHIRLFSHSFLGLGLNETMHQFLDTKSCFSNDYQLPDGSLAQGDASTCELKVKRLINRVHSVSKTTNAAINSNKIDDWYVVGGLSFLAQDKLFSFDGNSFTMKNLVEQGQKQACNQSWENLHEQYPSNEYLYSYCFASSYYYSLLVDGYGVNEHLPVHYMDKNSKSNDWTLGVVLQQH